MNRIYSRSIIIFMLLSALSAAIYLPRGHTLAAAVAWSAVVSIFHYLTMKAGRMSFYRTIFFGVLAAAFLLEMHMNFVNDKTLLPYCHIGMSANILSSVYNEYLAISNSAFTKYGALAIGFAWLLIIFINGGGFCSYTCFFGGIDDTVSSLMKKPIVKVPASTKIREFQLAVLLFFVFISFMYGMPAFCLWICPLKLSDCVLNPNSKVFFLQSALFISTGLVFLILLPLLTKKRFFCSMICPFGALPPLVHKIVPYKITINHDTCTKCGKCSEICPSFAIRKTGNIPQVTRFCTLCMKCVDSCPSGSIRPTLYGKKTTELIPFVSILLAGAISLFYAPQLLIQLVKLLS